MENSKLFQQNQDHLRKIQALEHELKDKSLRLQLQQ